MSLLLQMRGIEKSFGGVQALRGAELEVVRGEIHALVGENGAGKSTLLKILAGAYPHGTFDGTMRLDGKDFTLRSPADARTHGIAMVHQELMLIPELSVAANLFLGREPRGLFGLVDDAKLEADARALLARYGFADTVDASAKVGSLGVGLQQIVEIVRGLSHDARILVLDEPTASLTASETDRLMDWLRELRAAGTSSIYVSHRMNEVFTMADRITILRDGRTVRAVTTSETTPAEVVSLMVGRDLGKGAPSAAPQASAAAPALEVERLTVALPDGARVRGFALEEVSLSVRRGEVVAVCGAMGSGRTALLSTLFGCAEGEWSGSVRFDGMKATLHSPADAIRHGVAYLPEDRKEKGLVLDLSVRDNLALPSLPNEHAGFWGHLGIVDDGQLDLMAERRIRELNIRATASSPVATLSGGNQQKVALGKWLEHPPKVLLLDEPTRGVDIGAREEIYGILERLLEENVAVLMASSDLTEVLRLAHRILILKRGRIVAELRAKDATIEKIVQLTTGAVSTDPGVSVLATPEAS